MFYLLGVPVIGYCTKRKYFFVSAKQAGFFACKNDRILNRRIWYKVVIGEAIQTLNTNRFINAIEVMN